MKSFNYKLRSISDNMGFYIPHSINNPKNSNEYIDDLQFMVKNTDRTGSLNNTFKWTNILNNKITNMMYIYLHMMSLPLYPFIDKTEIVDIDEILVNLLIENHNNLLADQTIEYNDITIQILYIDETIIDYTIDNDYKNLYSLNLENHKLYLYTRSKRKISDDGFLYIDIDSNDNLNNNYSLNSSYQNKKFTFKLIPIVFNNEYVYYRGINQYIYKSVDKLVSIDKLTINIYNSNYKPLSNPHVNSNLYNDKNYNCNYLRHPLNNCNQIDISFKFSQVKNEQITQIFH